MKSRPDKFFTAEQQKRLVVLMHRWRLARDSGKLLPEDEESELRQLIDAEVEASGNRAAAAMSKLSG